MLILAAVELIFYFLLLVKLDFEVAFLNVFMHEIFDPFFFFILNVFGHIEGLGALKLRPYRVLMGTHGH